MADPKAELSRIRETLARSDADVLAALDARAKAIRDLLALRERDPDGYYAPPRTEEVLGEVLGRAEQFPRAAVEAVFREILGAQAGMIAPRTVAYFGTEGSFAHVAGRRHFGSSATFRALGSVEEVIDEVSRERVSAGVVPLETSTDGAVTATLHGLSRADVKIVAELTLSTSYQLASVTGNASDVEKIYGAPASIAACERYVREHFARAMVLDVPSAEVAAQFAREDHGSAAVTTDIMAELHGLRPVQERIEDVAGVETRFAFIARSLPSRTGTDRSVVAMAVSDSPGALYRSLQPFADRGINLTRLESRPVQGAAWRYLFFVELDGHVTDRPVLTALDELRSISRMVKVLGSYPRPAP